MKTYRIPCTWTVAGTVTVKANNLEEAIFEAENNSPLPADNDYIEGSFEVNNQMIPYLNKNLTETEMTEHCGEVIRW
jgi:hypothetical protein